MMKNLLPVICLPALALVLTACPDDEPTGPVPLAENIYAPLGDILPTATEEQRATFERGQAVAMQRFSPEQGLGPLFNVTFCAACHERPVTGGSAGHYRDFTIQANRLEDGSFILDSHGGVVTAYGNGEAPDRPALYGDSNVLAQRNPIPMFGVGLLAELPDSAILANADPDDANGDGISGRPNLDGGFVGRFGRKSQTVSIEGFIRGPLNNHLGVTTDPLPEEALDALPVPSGRVGPNVIEVAGALTTIRQAQAAAPADPLTDDDGVEDPEMTSQELFDLVAFSMLLAAPQPEPLDDASENGLALFQEIECTACHVQALAGPRGGLPVYSDLLLHDMGEELADGLEQGVATGSEFRTQPLWGISPIGPYLHDGRADTLDEAISLHGGEAQAIRDAYVALSDSERADIVAFLESLGGRSQFTEGLLPPDASVPEPGEPGAPVPGLSDADMTQWLSGRAVYDRDTQVGAGLGPVFNGDSCRACHFDPVIGGAGPLDVNVMRHGTWTEDGEFAAPSYGTILAKLSNPGVARREHTAAHNVFEPRQTPTTLGLGLIERIDEQAILELADPDDEDTDGIRGIAHVLTDGRLGRFGWKANVPTVREFVRDAMSNELGLTVEETAELTFGFLTDDDDVPDPELTSADEEALSFFIENLDRPYPVADNPAGRAVFETIGCDGCHVPEMPSAQGPVPVYSDILLHAVGPADQPGIPEGVATELHFRTPPLWGLSATAPYLHDGSATTVEDAILAHENEAETVRQAFEALDDDDRAVLIEFLEGL